jgi:SIR2-like protein
VILPIDDEANNRARNRLLEVMRSREAVAVTGAGLSSWAGYPSWPELLNRLANYAIDHSDGTPLEADRIRQIARIHENPLTLASRLGGTLNPSDFAAFIGEQFGRKPVTEVVSLVAALPFRHLITLNFDPTLEDALVMNRQAFDVFTLYQKSHVIKFLKSLSIGPAKYHKRLIHLHGRYSDPLPNVALTTEGYNSLYGTYIFGVFMQAIALTQRVVFVGFGFNDQNFLEPFRVAAQHMNGSHDLCHFAIVPFSEGDEDARIRNRYRDNWCVEPIFYPKLPPDDGQGGYSRFRTEIVRVAQDLETRPAEVRNIKVYGIAANAVLQPPPNDPEDLARAQQLTADTLEKIAGDEIV